MTRSEYRAVAEAVRASEMAGSSATGAESGLATRASGVDAGNADENATKSGTVVDAQSSAPSYDQIQTRSTHDQYREQLRQSAYQAAGTLDEGESSTMQSRLSSGHGDSAFLLPVASGMSDDRHALHEDSAHQGPSTVGTTPATSAALGDVVSGGLEGVLGKDEPAASRAASGADDKKLAGELSLLPSSDGDKPDMEGDETFGFGDGQASESAAPPGEATSQTLPDAGASHATTLDAPIGEAADKQGSPDGGRPTRSRGQKSKSYVIPWDKDGNVIKSPEKDTKKTGKSRSTKANSATPDQEDAQSDIASSSKSAEPKTRGARKEKGDNRAVPKGRSGKQSTKKTDVIEVLDDDEDDDDATTKSTSQASKAPTLASAPSASVPSAGARVHRAGKGPALPQAEVVVSPPAKRSKKKATSKDGEVRGDVNADDESPVKTGKRARSGKKQQMDDEIDESELGDEDHQMGRDESMADSAQVEDLADASERGNVNPSKRAREAKTRQVTDEIDEIGLRDGGDSAATDESTAGGTQATDKAAAATSKKGDKAKTGKRARGSKKQQVTDEIADSELGDGDGKTGEEGATNGKVAPTKAGRASAEENGKKSPEESTAEESQSSSTRSVLQESVDANAKKSPRNSIQTSTPAKRGLENAPACSNMSTPLGRATAVRRSGTPSGTPIPGHPSLSQRLHGRSLGTVLSTVKFRSPGLRKSIHVPALHLHRGPEKAARTTIDPEAKKLADKKKRQKGYDSDEERQKLERKHRKLAAMSPRSRRAYEVRRMEEDYVSSEDEDDGDADYSRSAAHNGEDDDEDAGSARKALFGDDDEEEHIAFEVGSDVDYDE